MGRHGPRAAQPWAWLPGAPREVLTGDLMGQVYGVPVRIVTLDDGRTVCLSELG